MSVANVPLKPISSVIPEVFQSNLFRYVAFYYLWNCALVHIWLVYNVCLHCPLECGVVRKEKKKKDPEIAKRTIAGGSGAVEQLGYPVTAWVVQERTCCLSGINGARDVTFVKEGHTDTPLPL